MRFFQRRIIAFVAAAAFSLPVAIHAQRVQEPEPAPLPPPIPAPVDRPYPGTIDLAVDATDVHRRIINVREKIPVEAGEITLLYPQWIPGNHSPTGPIAQFAGLITTVRRQAAWTGYATA